MEPNATIPMTPRTTTTVPCESEKLSECECERGRGRTQMSYLVTGVPTRKRAKRKLKTSEEDPNGATYSV
jgi:hypothetical protein